MDCFDHGGDVWSHPGVTLDFSVNLNPLGMPEGARRALLTHLDAFARYPDPYCRALCAALAARHGVDDAHILCGNGAADLLLRICACFKPRTVLTLAPTFSEYARCAALFSGAVRVHRLDEAAGFALADDVLHALTPDVDLFFLCNPNNPTGRLASPALLGAVLDACAQNGTLLVVDECFLDFTGAPSMAASVAAYPHLLVLRAFTKFYALSGLRLGYLTGDPALLNRIAPFGAPWSVSVPAQLAGLGALGEPDWEQKTRALVAGERAFLTAALSASGLTVFPGDANFLLLKSELPLFEPLLARGVLVRDASSFTGLDPRFLRVGVKTRLENEALIAAVREALHG